MRLNVGRTYIGGPVLCEICHEPCQAEAVLSDGSVYHVGCYESLRLRLTSLTTEDPVRLPGEQLHRKLVADIAGVRRRLAWEASPVSRFGRALTRRPPRIDNLRRLAKRLASMEPELRARAETERQEFNRSLSAERHSVAALLESLHDRWPTYPPDWDDRRELVLNMQGLCRECSTVHHLHVHHRVPVGAGGTHRLENLVVLCERCHSKAHGGASFDHPRSDAAGPFAKRTALIASAIARGECVRFSYRAFSRERTVRTIRPREFKLMGTRQGLCVVGHCYLRGEDRTFAVRRMRGVKVVADPEGDSACRAVQHAHQADNTPPQR